jgi:hypothetical protein
VEGREGRGKKGDLWHIFHMIKGLERDIKGIFVFLPVLHSGRNALLDGGLLFWSPTISRPEGR